MHVSICTCRCRCIRICISTHICVCEINQDNAVWQGVFWLAGDCVEKNRHLHWSNREVYSMWFGSIRSNCWRELGVWIAGKARRPAFSSAACENWNSERVVDSFDRKWKGERTNGGVFTSMFSLRRCPVPWRVSRRKDATVPWSSILNSGLQQWSAEWSVWSVSYACCRRSAGISATATILF